MSQICRSVGACYTLLWRVQLSQQQLTLSSSHMIASRECTSPLPLYHSTTVTVHINVVVLVWKLRGLEVLVSRNGVLHTTLALRDSDLQMTYTVGK
jgi:hypothetical protein